MNQIPEVVSRYLEDRESLGDTELAELVAALKNDPELAGQVRSELIVDEMLSQKLDGYRGDFPAQVQQRLRDFEQGEEELNRRADDLRTLAAGQLKEKLRTESRKQRFRIWSAAAAVLLMVSGAAMGYYAYYQSQTVAFVEGVTGNAVVLRGGQRLDLQSAARIAIGDQIRTPAGGAVVLRYPDGGVLQIGGGTTVGFPALQQATGVAGKRVRLLQGDILAKMGPQKKPMLLTTAVAEAEVVGTRFFLSATGGSTRLDVARGSVKLTHIRLGQSVLVAGGQTGVASRTGLKNQTAPWPVVRKGLVFVFQTNDRSRQLWDPSSADLHSYNLQPRGDAHWTHDYAMHASSGRFTAPPAVDQQILQSCTQSGAMTLELVVQFEKPQPHDPVRIVHMGDTANFAVLRRGKTVYFELQSGAAGSGKLASCEFTGDLFDGAQHHLAATASNGMLTCYVDGKKVNQTNYGTSSLAAWTAQELRFGDMRSRTAVNLEGVAVYNRQLSAAEVAASAATYLQIARSRPQVPQIEVIARLQTHSKVQDSDLAANANLLMVSGVEVLEPLRGKPEDNVLLVAHWAELNGMKQALAESAPGQVFKLVLESRENNPQLLNVPTVNHFTADSDASRTQYYVVKAEKVLR